MDRNKISVLSASMVTATVFREAERWLSISVDLRASESQSCHCALNGNVTKVIGKQ